MQVGIDYTAAATQHAGIGRSVREFVSAVLKQPDRPGLTLVYAHRGPVNEVDALAIYERVKVRRLPVSPRVALGVWHKARLPVPVEALIGPVNVFHGPDYALPPMAFARGVLTVHDLSFVVRPQDAHPAQRRFLESVVPRSIDRARLIVTVSEATKRDLSQRYGVLPHRIRVVPNAVSEVFEPIRDSDHLDQVRQRLLLPETFVLSVGTIQPRKNIDGLARAVTMTSKRTGIPIGHIHVGREGWLYEQVYAEIKRSGDVVRFVGHVDDRTLCALYSLAAAFVYPSHEEGFGIPILEAFACECPVVISASAAIVEVAGGSAIVADAADVATIADGLGEIVTDAAVRDDLVERGRARIGNYSWERSGRLMLDVYREAACAGGGS